ncbi:MAG: hypothetical protein JF612_10215 [Planctomycetia bacterium]|nr:hypothetical protein [Planctomycetia bacterium]
MDFVNQAYSQLVELIRSMSAGTRVATGLLIVLVVISLAYLFQYQVTGGDDLLLGGRPFTQSEMTAIEAAFAKAGLGKSTVSGSQIRIPRGKKELYLAALADCNALPADFYKYLDGAIKADNPFSSPRSVAMNWQNAKQKELALIIGRMSGIESASVLFDEEVKRGLTQTKQKTAMVSVQTRSGELDEGQVKAIRNVVASAYAGLDRRHISITDMSGRTYGGAIGPDGNPEDGSLYAEHKLRYEREYQRKIQSQLAYIAGVIVNVNAELNPEMHHSSTTTKYDPKPVTVISNETSKEQKSHAAGVAGRPGAVPNGVDQPGNRGIAVTPPAGGADSELTETRSNVQNLPGADTTLTQIAPLAAEIATIETATKKSIQEKVRNLLPDFDKGTDPYPHVVVETYTDLPKPAAVPPTLAQSSTTWLADNWQTLALIFVGLGSLLMLRSMVRSLPPATAAAATPAAGHQSAQPRLALHDPGDEEAEEEPAKALRARFQATGPDLRSELRDIVKENPDAAASILRAWIGEAA